MTKIFNTRHFGVSVKWNDSLLRIIEEVDLNLRFSKGYQKTRNEIVIYGKQGSDEIIIGREVIGNDTDFNNHESVKISDFSIHEGLTFEVALQKILDDKTLLTRDKSFESYRVLIQNFETCLVSLF